MPHLIQDFDRTAIGAERLKQDLAEGSLLGSALIHHPPWTGAETLPAEDIPALAEALSTPTADLARRLSRWRIPWRGVLLSLAAGSLLLLDTPTTADFIVEGAASLLSQPTGHLASPPLVVVMLAVPILLAGRVTALGSAALAGLVGGVGLSLLGILGEGRPEGLLGFGALFGAAGAAMGAVERVRPLLPPMKREWGQWGWWVLLGAVLVFAMQGDLLQETLPVVCVTGLSALLGHRLPDRWWLPLPGLLMFPLAEGISRSAQTAPQLWLRGWEVHALPASGVGLSLPAILTAPSDRSHRSREFTWTHRRYRRDFTPHIDVRVVVHESGDLPPRSASSRSARHGIFETTLTCTPDETSWQRALCAHILDTSTIAAPFQTAETAALLETGRPDARADHLVALFTAGQHAEGWLHLLEHYPTTPSHLIKSSRAEDILLWDIAGEHGQCQAMAERVYTPLSDPDARRALLRTCWEEATGSAP